MASQVFEVFTAGLLGATNFSDYTSADQKLVCMLIANGSDCGSLNDGVTDLTGFTPLNQHQGSINSVAIGDGRNAISTNGTTHLQQVTVTVTESTTTKYLTGNATSSGVVTWNSVAADSSNTIVGALLFKCLSEGDGNGATVTGTPVAFFEFSSPITPNGGNISVTFASSRMISLTLG